MGACSSPSDSPATDTASTSVSTESSSGATAQARAAQTAPSIAEQLASTEPFVGLPVQDFGSAAVMNGYRMAAEFAARTTFDESVFWADVSTETPSAKDLAFVTRGGEFTKSTEREIGRKIRLLADAGTGKKKNVQAWWDVNALTYLAYYATTDGKAAGIVRPSAGSPMVQNVRISEPSVLRAGHVPGGSGLLSVTFTVSGDVSVSIDGTPSLWPLSKTATFTLEPSTNHASGWQIATWRSSGTVSSTPEAVSAPQS